MKSKSAGKLLEQNRLLRKVITNKENTGRRMATECLEAYVANLKELMDEQLIQLRGRMTIPSNTQSENDYFKGAEEQLVNIKKTVEALYDITEQSINQTKGMMDGGKE